MAYTDDLAPTRATASSTSSARQRRASENATSRSSRAALADEEISLEAQVAQLQAELKSITTTLGRMGQTATSEIRSTAKGQVQHLADRGQSALDAAQDEFSVFEKQIKDTIREKPLTAVAGAVALGFILAVITR